MRAANDITGAGGRFTRKVPLRFVHLQAGCQSQGVGEEGVQEGGGSLVRFYWSAGEEPLVHGRTLAGKQDSDGLCKAVI